MKIVLLHHGSTDYNEGRKIDGQLNASRLTEIGKKQVRSSAKHLWKNKIAPEVIFSSDLHRTLETSAIVQDELGGQDKLPIIVDPRLREIDMGQREGTKMPAVFIGNLAAHLFDGIGIPYAKGGESNLEVRERIDDFFHDFFVNHGDVQCALVVTHQLPMQHAGKILNLNNPVVTVGVDRLKGADMWYFDTNARQPFVEDFVPSKHPYSQ